MQENNQTISEFSRRTDLLAARLGLNLSEIHTVLGISKAMVFAYRSGKNPITRKVWLKLEAAEISNQMERPPNGGNAESTTYLKDSDASNDENFTMTDDVVTYQAQPKLSLEARVEKLEKALKAMADILRDI